MKKVPSFVWIALLVAAAVFVIYRLGRGAGRNKLKTSRNEIPAGWAPGAVSETVRRAILGYKPWFDPDKIAAEGALMALSDGQLAAVYNDYYERYHENLLENMRDDSWGEQGKIIITRLAELQNKR